MPIFKLQQRTNYAAIPNETLRDKRLSIEARGVLAYLLTHSDTFELSFEFLQKELGIGRDKMNKIARELKVNGYLELRAAHNKKGKFAGQEWFVYAESQNVDFCLTVYNRPTEKPSDVKTVRRENRQTENTEDNIKENSSQKKSIKELEQKENKDSLSARPRTRLTLAEAVGIIEAETPEAETNQSPTRAIEIYREIFPTAELEGQKLADFALRLPEVEEALWRQNLLDWRLSGWNRANISDMAKRYERELEKSKNGVNQNAVNQRYQPNDAGTRNAQRIDNTDAVIAELLRQGALEQKLLGERDVIG